MSGIRRHLLPIQCVHTPPLTFVRRRLLRYCSCCCLAAALLCGFSTPAILFVLLITHTIAASSHRCHASDLHARLMDEAKCYDPAEHSRCRLAPFRDALLVWRAKSASYEQIAAALTRHGLKISPAGVGAFCRRTFVQGRDFAGTGPPADGGAPAPGGDRSELLGALRGRTAGSGAVRAGPPGTENRPGQLLIPLRPCLGVMASGLAEPCGQPIHAAGEGMSARYFLTAGARVLASGAARSTARTTNARLAGIIFAANSVTTSSSFFTKSGGKSTVG